MKKYIKRNQVLITALAIMIAIAGYLSFQDKQKESSKTLEVAQNEENMVYDLSLEELAQEDLYLEEGEMETVAAANFLETDMEILEGEAVAVNTDGMNEEADELSEEEIRELTPGEAVFTSTQAVSTLSGAKLMKEQTRAKNKEALLEIVNNTNISDEAKMQAIESMVLDTEIAEKETNAEIMLEAKGFLDAVVSVSNDTVDVCVVAEELTDAQRAQIEDIVQRKTDVSPENIIITTVW